MKQIFLIDLLGFMRECETIVLRDGITVIGTFRVDKLLGYFYDSALLNREVAMIESGNSDSIRIILKPVKGKEN